MLEKDLVILDKILKDMNYTPQYREMLLSGLVNKLEDWNFSSFKDYAGLRDGKLCNKKILLELTDYELSTFYQDSYHVISNGKMFFENE
jgi:hypothetical protein